MPPLALASSTSGADAMQSNLEITPFFDRRGEFREQGDGCRPVNAGIRDALPIGQRFTYLVILSIRHEMAFHHKATDIGRPCGDLGADGVDNIRLTGVVLLAIAVTTIYHETMGLPSNSET